MHAQARLVDTLRESARKLAAGNLGLVRLAARHPQQHVCHSLQEPNQPQILQSQRGCTCAKFFASQPSPGRFAHVRLLVVYCIQGLDITEQF